MTEDDKWQKTNHIDGLDV